MKKIIIVCLASVLSLLIGSAFLSAEEAGESGQVVAAPTKQQQAPATSSPAYKEGIFMLEGHEKELASSIDNTPIKMVDPNEPDKVVSEKMFTDMATLEIEPISGFSATLNASLWFKEDITDKDIMKALTTSTVERLHEKVTSIGLDTARWGLEIVCTSKLGEAPHQKKIYGKATYNPFKREVTYIEE